MSSEANSYTWYRVTPDHPAIGARVLVWDPACGVRFAYRNRDAFRERLQGLAVELKDIVWWTEEPGRPPGEVDPSEYHPRRTQAPQIGFAASGD